MKIRNGEYIYTQKDAWKHANDRRCSGEEKAEMQVALTNAINKGAAILCGASIAASLSRVNTA